MTGEQGGFRSVGDMIAVRDMRFAPRHLRRTITSRSNRIHDCLQIPAQTKDMCKSNLLDDIQMSDTDRQCKCSPVLPYKKS